MTQPGRLCMYKCINTAGSYYCQCPTGYSVSKDNRSCQGWYPTLPFFLSLKVFAEMLFLQTIYISDVTLFRTKDIEFNSAFSLGLYLIAILEPSAVSEANYNYYVSTETLSHQLTPNHCSLSKL